MTTHHRTDRFVGSQKINTDEVLQVINFPNSHQSTLYIDSDDKNGFYNAGTYENPGKLIRQDISQIGVKKVVINYNIPNVNTLNNNFIFSIGEAIYNIIVPIGYYADILEFMTALTIEMNLAQGVTVFSYLTTPFPGGLVASGGTLWAWRVCNGISNNSLHGLFYFEGSTNSQTVSGNMLYTEYIDILISRVKDAQITTNTYTSIKPYDTKEHIARIYLDNHGQSGVSEKIITTFENVDYFPYRKRQLTQFKIDMHDEYGNLLYVDSQTISGSSYEIKYLTYEIELSLLS